MVKNLKKNSKKFQLYENNQYGHGMMKLLPTVCIKNDDDISWKTFNYLLEKVSLDDEVGHLYVADIGFDVADATPEQKTVQWNLSTNNWKTKNYRSMWLFCLSIARTVCRMRKRQSSCL